MTRRSVTEQFIPEEEAIDPEIWRIRYDRLRARLLRERSIFGAFLVLYLAMATFVIWYVDAHELCSAESAAAR